MASPSGSSPFVASNCATAAGACAAPPVPLLEVVVDPLDVLLELVDVVPIVPVSLPDEQAASAEPRSASRVVEINVEAFIMVSLSGKFLCGRPAASTPAKLGSAAARVFRPGDAAFRAGDSVSHGGAGP
jgi:hypothetical protein